jgi:hypothetical protein
LQHAARQRTKSHNLHRIKDLRAISILQDVAVNGRNVGRERAPEHALNLGSKYSFENRAPDAAPAAAGCHKPYALFNLPLPFFAPCNWVHFCTQFANPKNHTFDHHLRLLLCGGNLLRRTSD